jgi:hypothetical protein
VGAFLFLFLGAALIIKLTRRALGYLSIHMELHVSDIWF